MVELTKWFLDWRFRLTAKEIYVLNHSLFTVVMGTTITYIIFIVQLQADEGVLRI
ncbi:unnamed protein product [Allacma fusca]|uniref:Uncharacterized protein n=1 Tax=Allacma fusca TaxID=39272 RepID=A0A8J2KXH0_9HEXA|nr:unnamed protein product [Allacma fusca]